MFREKKAKGWWAHFSDTWTRPLLFQTQFILIFFEDIEGSHNKFILYCVGTMLLKEIRSKYNNLSQWFLQERAAVYWYIHIDTKQRMFNYAPWHLSKTDGMERQVILLVYEMITIQITFCMVSIIILHYSIEKTDLLHVWMINYNFATLSWWLFCVNVTLLRTTLYTLLHNHLQR